MNISYGNIFVSNFLPKNEYFSSRSWISHPPTKTMVSLTPPNFPIRYAIISFFEKKKTFYFRSLEIDVVVDQKPQFLTILWTTDNKLMFALLLDKNGPQLSQSRYYRSLIGNNMESLINSIMDKVSVFCLTDKKFEVVDNIRNIKEKALEAARNQELAHSEYLKFYKKGTKGKPFLVIGDHKLIPEEIYREDMNSSTFVMFDKTNTENIPLSEGYEIPIIDRTDHNLYCLFGKNDEIENVQFLRHMEDEDNPTELSLLHNNLLYTNQGSSNFFEPVCIKGEINLPNISKISAPIDVSEFTKVENPWNLGFRGFPEGGKYGVHYPAGTQFQTINNTSRILSSLVERIKDFPSDLESLTSLLKSYRGGEDNYDEIQ